jgi:thiol-disulfide isomerase/thioredoxin
MKIFFLSFSFLFFAVTVNAQETVITGTAAGAEGKLIQLHTPGDLITFLEKPLVSTRVDSSGHFSLTLKLDRTIYAVLSINFHKTEIFLEPLKTYRVKIAPMNYDDYKEINPFVQASSLLVEIIYPQPDELNILIGDFNALYNAFVLKHFNDLYRDRNKATLDTFKISINDRFVGVTNAYFNNYMAYKVASLEQLTHAFSSPQLIKNYFSGRPVLYENLEYMDFFNTTFSKYLTVTSRVLRKADYPAILRGPDPYAVLMKLLATDSALHEVQLRELVLLKGMMEMYNTVDYPKEEVLGVIRAIGDKSSHPGNKVVSEDMIRLLTRLKPGSEAPDFSLADLKQNQVSLKSLRGKPVLIGFWTTYCQGCLSDMDLIKPLFDKYKDRMAFLSISADKEFYKMLYFINLKPNYVWTFLHLGENSQLLKDYDVRSYPLFVLIDKNGKIYQYPADQPGNGLEATIEKLLQE